MLKAYEVTVTYRLYALDETDATSQVMNKRVEPDTIDVSLSYVNSTLEVTLPDF